MEANPGTFEAERFAAYRFGRREPAVDRRSVVRPGEVEGAGAHPRPRASRGCRRARAPRLRQLQPRPDVRPAVAVVRRSAGRRRGRAAVRAAAPVAVPAHARAQHRLREVPAGGAGRRHRRRNAGVDRSAHGAGRLPSLRGVGVCAARPRMPSQPELLALRGLPWRRGGRPQQDLVSPPHRPAGALSPAGCRISNGPRAASSSPNTSKSVARTFRSSSC